MATLQIHIVPKTIQDYEGVSENIKRLCGHIDGKKLQETWTEEEVVDDATCKTNYKTKLTELGYTWDTEI